MTFFLRPITAFIVSAVLAGCQLIAPKSEPEVPVRLISEQQKHHANQQAEAIFSEYLQWRQESSPTLASRMGVTGQFDWDDISAEAQERDIEIAQQLRQRLTAIDELALSPTNLGSYHSLMSQLKHQLLLSPLALLQDPLSDQHNWLIKIESTLLNHHPIHTIEDAHDYIARINALPALLARWQELLKARTDAGYHSPRFAFQPVIQRLNQWLQPTTESQGQPIIWRDFEDKIRHLALYPSTEKLLLKQMKKALKKSATPALSALKEELQQQQQLAPAMVSLQQQNQGLRYYQLLLQKYSQTDLDANQIFQFALTETSAVQQQIMTIAQASGWQKDSEQLRFQTLKNWLPHHQTSFNQQDKTSLNMEALNGFQRKKLQQLAELLPYMFTHIPEAPLAVTTEKNVTTPYSSASKAMSYIPAGGAQVAQFNWSPQQAISQSQQAFELNLIRYAVPGLHMQLALAQENQQLPEFRRQPYLAEFNPGWLMYSQQLIASQKKRADLTLALLLEQLHQLVTIVVDTGIHAKGWNRLEAVEFMQQNLLISVEGAQPIIDQVMLSPAASSAIYFNYLALEQLREKTEKKLHQESPEVTFDAAEYHSTVLQFGALPMAALMQQINLWSEQKIRQVKALKSQTGNH